MSTEATPAGTQPLPERLVRVGAWASLAAALLMALMVLVGAQSQAQPTETARLMLVDSRTAMAPPTLAWLLAVDSAFLLCSALAWLALGSILQRSASRLGMLVAALGLLAVALDFVENEMQWSAARLLSASASGTATDIPAAMRAGWALAWHLVQGLSYWPLSLAAALAGVLSWRYLPGGSLLLLLGALGVAAASSIYVIGPTSLFGWILGWHLGVAWTLWRAQNRRRASIER